ncbi:hypothetical protein [Mucilaginibacter sp.]|uniref:hypothetical protein n=1 Tax=Mucilaginibacter sp. TaxID=1882438 RepID=UPI0035BBEB7E
MKHKIKLPDGTAQLIEITSAYFKSWQVWKVKFADGKAAMLFKLGSEWMQRNEDFLDEKVIAAVGNRIDSILSRRKLLSL